MKTKIILFFILINTFFSSIKAQNFSYTAFDEILFYDGYATVVDYPVPEGVIRHRNDLYARKLTEDVLDSFGDQVTMNVTIKAACDNYDRIGNVNLAFVPKGQATYSPDNVERIEIGRYITPFMNKNVSPTEVPYTYSVNNLGAIFKDPVINATYDIWVELELFGVPYAANTQVAGCSGRSDVFFGSLEFVSSGNVIENPQTFLLPLSMKANFNNYQTGATDQIGTTTKTITFTLTEDIEEAKFYLITSNHGAGSGGEEYVRRWHYVSFDGTQIISYRPGGISCEPYRVYNTQANGIYGTTAQSLFWWMSWNNWCPGNSIPIREINLGALTAGTHTFVISVPDAQFVNQDGNFPLSLYLQGQYIETAGLTSFDEKSLNIYPNPAKDFLTIDTSENIANLKVVNILGERMSCKLNSNRLDISHLEAGIYIVQVEFENGVKLNNKIVKQ